MPSQTCSHTHTHMLILLQIGPCSLIITHSRPCLLSGGCITPNTQPEKKEKTPTSFAGYSSAFCLKKIQLCCWNPACVGTRVFSSCHPELNSLDHLQGLWGLLTVPCGVTRWGLRYCDVLMFPKCADEKISAMFESDVVIPPCCRCLNTLQCKQQEECHQYCHHSRHLGAQTQRREPPPCIYHAVILKAVLAALV